MDIREPIHSDHAKTLDSAGLRTQFLVDALHRKKPASAGFFEGNGVACYSDSTHLTMPLRSSPFAFTSG